MLVTSTLWWMVAKTVGIMVICGSTTHTNKNPTRPCIKRDLTPNCYQEGETFLGFPLSRKSKSSLQSISTFQQQFNFERILEQNFTYIISFGTNHGWLVSGEQTGNGVGSLVETIQLTFPYFTWVQRILIWYALCPLDENLAELFFTLFQHKSIYFILTIFIYAKVGCICLTWSRYRICRRGIHRRHATNTWEQKICLATILLYR